MATGHVRFPTSDLTAEEQRTQLRLLTGFAADGVVVMDDSGHLIEWSPRAEEIHARTDRTEFRLILPDDPGRK